MNLAALFSGGKDSTFSIYKAQKLGHTVSCLVTILTSSEESHLLHHPNIELSILQAKSMNIPQILVRADSTDTKKEVELLNAALDKAKTQYNIEGIVHGGILSEFQKTQFESAAKSLGLQVISPLWKKDQYQYMQELLNSGFEFIITAVSCDGLDDSWLGKKITKKDLDKLVHLSQKHKFNLSFEGGEAETFVTNCPLFSEPIKIQNSRKEWDGYRGRFEIVQAKIEK
jgi:ABC transporter with metal-binding/Fe-S-binding domain ATP-binding protein